MLSILHISDLHRSATDPVENSEIITSLLRDRDRYTRQSPPVLGPNAVIVSGDMIQGVGLGHTNYSQALRDQYQQASRLLDDIAKRFVASDRARVIVCAGNHDICWNTALSAMEEVTSKDELSRLSYRDFYDPESSYRWDWKTKRALKIKDRNIYDSRIDQYWDFVEEFYKDVNLTYPINRKSGFNLFELESKKVVVASFNSIKGNDCYAFHGAISTTDVADCSLKIRDSGNKYALQIAVWHHGIYTPPPNADYMAMDPLYDMANEGFGLGLHGHQHQAAHAVQYIHIPEQRRFPIVSAGSLCAGGRELPTGYNRQYNIIEISDDYLSGKVYIRERTKSNIFTAAMRPEFGLNGAVDLQFDPPDKRTTLAGSNLSDLSKNRQVVEAETLLRAGHAREAALILESCDLKQGSLARQLFFEAVNESGSWPSLKASGVAATSAAELSILCDGILVLDGIEVAIDVARAYAPTSQQDKIMHDEILSRLHTKKLIGKL